MAENVCLTALKMCDMKQQSQLLDLLCGAKLQKGTKKGYQAFYSKVKFLEQEFYIPVMIALKNKGAYSMRVHIIPKIKYGTNK